MNNLLLFVTPLVLLLILLVFGFTGCGELLPPPDDPEKPPADPTQQPGTKPSPVGPVGPPGPGPVTVPAATPEEAYEEAVKATPGFAAYWPLNEDTGSLSRAVPLSADADGAYIYRSNVPPGTDFKIGQQGVLYTKDTVDLAPEFFATAAYVQVPFRGPLNPGKAVTGFTVELWAKPDPAAGGDIQVLISSHRFDSGSAQQGYEIALVRNPVQPIQQVRGRVFANGAMTEIVLQPLQGDPADWRHIVLIYEQSQTTPVVPLLSIQVRLAKATNPYKDGPHAANYEAVVSTSPSSLRFGAGHAAGQFAENFFAGRIDKVAFYNAPLSQADIDSHFNLI